MEEIQEMTCIYIGYNKELKMIIEVFHIPVQCRVHFFWVNHIYSTDFIVVTSEYYSGSEFR